MSDERIERVAREICGLKCLRAESFSDPCVDAAGRNAPCRATTEQLLLSWRWDAAYRAVETIEAEIKETT